MTEPLPFEKSSDRVTTFTCGTRAQFRDAFNAFAKHPNNTFFIIHSVLWDPRGGEVSETIGYSSAESVEHLVNQDKWYNQTALRKDSPGLIMTPTHILKVIDLKGDFDAQFALTRAESLARLPTEAQVAIEATRAQVEVAMAEHAHRCQPLLKRLFSPKR